MKLTNENGIPLYVPFKAYFGKEIKDISKYECMRQNVNLSKYLTNGNELYMHGCSISLVFIHSDNSKPLFYEELEFVNKECYEEILDYDFKPLSEIKLVSKRFDEKFKTTSYKFPYYEVNEPEKLVASKTENGFFSTTVLEYTKVKESKRREIDHRRIEEIIYEVLEKHNAFTY